MRKQILSLLSSRCCLTTRQTAAGLVVALRSAAQLAILCRPIIYYPSPTAVNFAFYLASALCPILHNIILPDPFHDSRFIVPQQSATALRIFVSHSHLCPFGCYVTSSCRCSRTRGRRVLSCRLPLVTYVHIVFIVHHLYALKYYVENKPYMCTTMDCIVGLE